MEAPVHGGHLGVHCRSRSVVATEGVGYNPRSGAYTDGSKSMANDAYEVMDLKALQCFWAMAKHGSLTQVPTS